MTECPAEDCQYWLGASCTADNCPGASFPVLEECGGSLAASSQPDDLNFHAHGVAQ